jgi:hypothetical protein
MNIFQFLYRFFSGPVLLQCIACSIYIKECYYGDYLYFLVVPVIPVLWMCV